MRKEMAVSIVLAIALVAGAIVIADRSLATKATTGNSSLRHQGPHATSAAAHLPLPASFPAPHTFHGISKCLRNGEISYSNHGCPPGTIPERVVLHDTAGIENRNRELLAALRAGNPPVARREGGMIQHVAHPASAKSTDQAHKQLECAALKQQIASVDARARQPQSAQSQDRLREEKKKLRDRYSALRC